MTVHKTKLLLIEDDIRLAELIRDYIEAQGFQVTMQHRGDKAVAEFNAQLTDIIILDLMLPGLDGLQVCQQIRQSFKGPILILTAKNSDIDHVMGLELGADDFVTKPIEPPVLLARLRALLRRAPDRNDIPKTAERVKDLVFGTLTLNWHAQHAHLQNNPIELTTQEFFLLWLLASKAGEILSREQIFNNLRGIGYDGIDRTVDIRISHLRKKLQDDLKNPKRIKTVWGKGYLFVAENWD
jgi:DNA-binding response OmpR family regulator